MKTSSRFSRKLLNITAAFALMLGVCVGTLAVNPSPASASATSCRQWGWIQYKQYSLPTGQYCFTVNGSGTRINNTRGSWNSVWMVNPSEMVRFYDRWGTNYATFRTYSATGTLAGGYHAWNTSINGTAKAGGRACGTLYSSGNKVTEACVAIY